MRELFSRLSAVISEETQRPFEVSNAAPVGGGSINDAYRIESGDGTRYFLKLNDACHLPMFVAETAGLETIAATNTLRVPRPIAHGITGEHSYLVLEHLELNSHGDANQLGERLAALHRCIGNQFGFSQDNFIGTTSQQNAAKGDWIDFWCERRLGFQLQLAEVNGFGRQLHEPGARLLAAMPAFFEGYSPQPSLLHGDLWSGNQAYLDDGTPAVFDPAVYYGDRECDIAMTELFGGYPASFYAAYRATWPVDAGYAVRRDLYNLYHILNHANLFGGSYVQQAASIMQRLLSQAA
jgi:fructosamine-3-kinase